MSKTDSGAWTLTSSGAGLRAAEVLIALAAFVLLATALCYRATLDPTGTRIPGASDTDMANHVLPTLDYAAEQLRHGELPQWNPYVCGGTPFLAGLHVGVFYPSTWLHVLLGTPRAITWTIVLHLALAGWSAYLFSRHLGLSPLAAIVAGVAFTTGAPTILRVYAGHLSVLRSLAWAPMLFLLTERTVRSAAVRDGVLLAFTVALLFLAGHPQYFFYAMLSASAYALFLLARDGQDRARTETARHLIVFGGWVVVGLTLTAVQFLPTLDFLHQSSRARLPLDFVAMFSFPPENLCALIVPGLFGDLADTPYWGKWYLWEVHPYVGIAPLLLAAVAVVLARDGRARFFAVMAVVTVILSFGKYTPLLRLMYETIPGFDLWRCSARWLFLTNLALAVLAGYGLDILLGGQVVASRRRLAGSVAVPAAVAALIVLGLLGVFGAKALQALIGRMAASPDFFSNAAAVHDAAFAARALHGFRADACRSLFFLALSAGAMLILVLRPGQARKIAAAVIVGLAVVDLTSFAARNVPAFDSRQSRLSPDVVALLRQDASPFRVLALGLPANSTMLDRIETLGGYESMILDRTREFLNLVDRRPLDHADVDFRLSCLSRLTDLLNVRYVIVPAGHNLDSPALRKVLDNGHSAVYHNAQALPRAFIAHDAKVVAGRNAILTAMTRSDFDPGRTVILEQPTSIVPLTVTHPPAPEFVRFLLRTPQRVLVEAELNAPGFLVLADTWAPDWSVYVNGQQGDILRADYVIRAVALPAGPATVEFRYEPTAARLGAAISLLAVVLLAYLIWRSYRPFGRPCPSPGRWCRRAT